MIDIKKCVKSEVTFSFYRDGNLWYETSEGDLFPVPTSDVGTATMKASDKGLLFMRYMRKFNSKEESEMSPVKDREDYEV